MDARERIPGEALLRAGGDGAGDGAGDGPLIGVLALQGDVLEHLRMLRRAGARSVAVKRPDQLDRLDGILIPGGESTTIGKLASLYGLFDPLRERMEAGMAAFGTCAGAILLGRQARLFDGSPSPQPLLGVMDTVVRRNAFGRQVESFEAAVSIRHTPGPPMSAVFIRAPWFDEVGPDVEILASVGTPLGDKVVVARQGPFLASAFHPELADDDRLHRLFVEMVRKQV